MARENQRREGPELSSLRLVSYVGCFDYEYPIPMVRAEHRIAYCFEQLALPVAAGKAIAHEILVRD